MTWEPTDRLAVVGGGVTGLTTAVLMQLHGYRTVLFSHRQATREIAAMRLTPEFASVHAAASVLPHSVRSSSGTRWTEISQRYFEVLAFRATCGVRKQRHFEVYEEPVDAPSYAGALAGFEFMSGDRSRVGAPSRKGVGGTHGWSFDAYFCEGPSYLRFLEELYLQLDGKFVLTDQALRLDSLSNAGYSLVINCTGIGSAAFLTGDSSDEGSKGARFSPLLDDCPSRTVRGHWIRARLSGPLAIPHVGPVSYNYTPRYLDYPAADDKPGDVYCYPRSDAWVLGGSRQELLDLQGDRWAGDDVEKIQIPDASGNEVSIPSVILALNDELVRGLSNGTIALREILKRTPGLFYAGIGYRFERNHPRESVRVECSLALSAGRPTVVVHNYGHGGAGFTLSWGCATDVLRHLAELAEEGWRFPKGQEPHRAGWDDLRRLLVEAGPTTATPQAAP